MSAGLYIHIPFCLSKCDYCDFYSFRADGGTMDAYLAALKKTLRFWGSQTADTFDTVYFGGGTPSVFGAGRLTETLDTVRRSFRLADDVQITVECNPSSVTAELAAALSFAGVNRVSLGLQSAVAAERSALGRRSTVKQAEAALTLFRNAGIDDLSLDLMLGIPGQTPQSLRESLRFLESTGVRHVSAYLLKLEETTPLFARRDTLSLPDEDAVCDLYLQAANTLEQMGLRQYEISNFAVPGFESRHNLHYWLCEPYLGIGPAAHSFLCGRRFYYPRDLQAFLNGDPPVFDCIGGDKAEFCMLRLRLTQGLCDNDFYERFGEHLPKEMFTAAKALARHGLLTTDGDTIALTKEGFLVSNSVIGKLLESF